MNDLRFYMIFDASLCNPNGDPYTGMPRVLSDDRAVMTTQSIKYKLKRHLHGLGYPVLHYTESGETIKEKIGFHKGMTDTESFEKAREFLDIRLFGACDLAGGMILKADGPVTFEIPVTYDPVLIQDISINRGYSIGLKDDGSNDGSGFRNPMNVIEFGLFHFFGGINIRKAEKIGLTDEDVSLFKDSLIHLFEDDAAAIRPAGSMNVRKLIFWNSDDRIYPDIVLKESVRVVKKTDGSPTCFDDYDIKIKKLEGIHTEIIDL